MNHLWIAILLHCVLFGWLAPSRSVAEDCTTGVLQMQPFTAGAHQDSIDPSACSPTASLLDSNRYYRVLCNVALKTVLDNKTNILHLFPLPLDKFALPEGTTRHSQLACKDYVAAGLVSGTSVKVGFFDLVQGPLPRLYKSGKSEVSLQMTVDPTDTPYAKSTCKYTVVSGCVLGAKAPAKPVALTCAKGWFRKPGAGGLQYCAPCPAGSSSKGGRAAACSLCPKGTYSPGEGSQCLKCPFGTYAAGSGAHRCKVCLLSDEEKLERWTDGTKCQLCPKGSYQYDEDPVNTMAPVKRANPTQCMRCSAGKRCCTVNWSKDCPKCPAGPLDPKTYISIFSLASTSPPACIRTMQAACTPGFTINLDNECQVTVEAAQYAYPRGQGFDCSWFAGSLIQGAGVVPTRDFPKYATVADNTMALPNLLRQKGARITFSSPFISFYIPSIACTLNYRALTKPAAAVLGVAPKPCPRGTPGCPSKSNPSTCPAGHYQATISDTKPSPCLPCQPGWHQPKRSAQTCIPCSPGTYAPGYANTACKPCAPNRTSLSGAGRCEPCGKDFIRAADDVICKACPEGLHSADGAKSPTCLGNYYGSICCGAGLCGSQPKCPARMPSSAPPLYSAVAQLISKSLPQPTCKAAAWLRCMAKDALVQLASTDASFVMNTLTPSSCRNMAGIGISGTFQSATVAEAQEQAFMAGKGDNAVAYYVQSSKAHGTVTVTLAAAAGRSLPLTKCWATFKLLAGYAFDLSPPKGSKCPSSTITQHFGGRVFCNVCEPGNRQKNSKCEACPDGTYQNEYAATSCKRCPAGAECIQSSRAPALCTRGYYSKAGQACQACAQNTFAPSNGSKACKPCPQQTGSLPGSTECWVPPAA